MQQPVRHSRRPFAILALASMAVLAPLGLHAAPSSRPSAGSVCTLEPAADTMPLGPSLIGTVRANGVDVEVLHRLDCDGRTVTWKWIGGDAAMTAGS